jgi:RNA polymerase sigma-70 factor (ECF subfamily)
MEKNSSKQERFLVLLAQSGDLGAFDELLESIQGFLFQYIHRLTRNRELAKDILQEVFLITYRKLKWLEDPSLFRPWVYRIASREAFRILKKEKVWTDQVREDDVLEKISAFEENTNFEPELIEKIPDMLGNISPASRAVLILHYLEEMTIGEVAEVLDINPGTVKSRLNYGLEALRKVYGR